MESQSMLKRLQEYHKEIALHHVMGFSRNEMVELFQSHVASLNALDRIIADPLFKEHVASLRDRRDEQIIDNMAEVENSIKGMMLAAAGKLKELMDNAKADSVQLRAALGILYIGGMKPKVKEEDVKEMPALTVTESVKFKEKNTG